MVAIILFIDCSNFLGLKKDNISRDSSALLIKIVVIHYLFWIMSHFHEVSIGALIGSIYILEKLWHVSHITMHEVILSYMHVHCTFSDLRDSQLVSNVKWFLIELTVPLSLH